VRRITRPGGVICIKKDGRWTKSVKPRPEGMDDWKHPNHGPDGNMVSADRVVQFPVGLRWLDGVPLNFNLWAACRGWVIADGRCFTLSTTELENIGPACFSPHSKQEYLTARDAFNGLPLWKVNCQTTNDGQALNARNTTPLVTDGKRVYVYETDRLTALEAPTGRVVMTYAVKYPSARLILADGVLVSAGWEAKEEAKDSGRPPLWSFWVAKTPKGAVEAFDAEQGKPRWSLSSPALEIVTGDGLLYALTQAGNPATQQEILALDLQTGREKWRVPHARFGEPTLHLCCAGPKVLVVARVKAKAISVLSAANGAALWQITPTENFFTPVVDGLLWNGNTKYDPQTGQVRGKLSSGIYSAPCTPSAVVGDYVTACRGGDHIRLVSSSGSKPASAAPIQYRAVRGACIEGATPANGMFYTGQNYCRCTPGQVPGFVAFGPNGDPPSSADFARPRPIEKGPAFGAFEAAEASKDDWPTYRHDPERSGATAARMPAGMKLLWQTQAARPAAGPLADVWKARLAGCLTAPVAAGGRVFVAAIDAGQVVAFDAASGKPLWQTTVGGRIDSPPTIHRGLCLFGCHDGWIYALRAKDGQLAWRTRAAPWERRMVAFGQVESVWPAPGSVLVHNGLLYATAGRTTESDGGVAVCALDPASGKRLWATAIGPGPGRQNDVIMLRDGSLTIHHIQIDPASGKHTLGKAPANAGLEGLIDGSWTRLGNRRSGNLAFGRAVGEMLAWNGDTLFGYECGPRVCFALARTKTLPPDKPDPKDKNADKLKPTDYTWRVTLPANHQAEAMALCENVLLLAGKICQPKSDRTSGFLRHVSLHDGKRTAEYPLDVPPNYDGLAVAGQRAYLTDQSGRVLCFGSL
jgi:outer membrane protein assembly factor BamB